MNGYLKKIWFCIVDYIFVIIAELITLHISGYLDCIFETRVVALIFFILYPASLVLALYVVKVYNILWEFSNFISYFRILIATVASSAFVAISHYAVIGNDKPYSLLNSLLISLLAFFIISADRVLIANNSKKTRKLLSNISGKIMIIGAGSAGNIIINDIKENFKNKCVVKCIIDDDPYKKGCIINGVTVVGGTDCIVEYADKFDIDLIVFAIPSCSSSKKSAILNICQKTKCKVKVLPAYYQLVGDEGIDYKKLREVQIEDLLGRDPVDIKVNSVLNYVSNKVVLVTGGGGSIGSELCRQIAMHNPNKLIVFDIYENNAYDIQNELHAKYPELDLIVLIGSVRDENRLNSIFEKYIPNLVFHAAAHKHVPLMEDSPNESIKNNVFGTYNVAKCADKFGVERFVLISTDKAVNPTNIMGASKRICEMVIQHFNGISKTEYVAVRFGNVLGSNGSVIPLFKKQIEKGGPVTVTDPNIIRYFMTIPEAVSLVLQAGASANGGEIFVLDMGEPVKIIDLAENLIKLSGFTPYIDIKIEFTGLRPGEKMYEEKLLAEEGLKRTENRLIHIGKPIDFDNNEFISDLKNLKETMSDDNADIRKIVAKIVPTYNYNK